MIRLAPAVAARARWRRVLGEPGSAAGGAPAHPSPAAAVRAGGSRSHRRRSRHRPSPQRSAASRSALAVLLAAVIGASAGGICGGPVAAGVGAAYTAAAALAWLRSRRARVAATALHAAVDAVAMLAADLRAGQSVGAALDAAGGWLAGPAVAGREAATVARRVHSAVALAESSGAPLAEVLERLDTHLRAIGRARATVSAQSAGARASALLLALMPVAGAGLGYLVGVDPLYILLRTTLGAACVAGAIALQLVGLAWSVRLSRIEIVA